MRHVLSFLLAAAVCFGSAQTITVGANVHTRSNPNAQNETSIAYSLTDALKVVGGFNDYSVPSITTGCGCMYSADGGATWNYTYLANPRVGTYDGMGDPAIAAGPGGIFYYSGIAFNRSVSLGKSGVVAFTSADGGATWAPHEVVYNPDTYFHDKSYICVDPINGNAYVAWSRYNASSADLVYSYTTNSGGTWSSPKIIVSGNGYYPDLVTDTAGNLYVVHMFFTGANGNARVAKIVNPATPSPTITNSTVGPFVEIGNNGYVNGNGPRCTAMPAISYYAASGTFAVVWPSKISDRYNGIMASTSANGTTWTSALRVDDGTSKDRYFPWIAVAPNGTLCACWYDNRNDPSDYKIDVYAAVSADGGATWMPDFLVTTAPSNPSSQFGGQFFGDYIGVSADASSAFHPTWCDARGPAYEQDIYTATVTYVPPLRMTVQLENYVATLAGYGLTLEVWNSGSVVYTKGITLAADGTATVTLPVGLTSMDHVSLVGPRFLREKVAYAGAQMHNFYLMNGDVDASNSVNLIDLSSVLADFGMTTTDPVDLNGNGTVDLLELSIILGNFNFHGD